jgi:hypothetical protein
MKMKIQIPEKKQQFASRESTTLSTSTSSTMLKFGLDSWRAHTVLRNSRRNVQMSRICWLAVWKRPKPSLTRLKKNGPREVGKGGDPATTTRPMDMEIVEGGRGGTGIDNKKNV